MRILLLEDSPDSAERVRSALDSVEDTELVHVVTGEEAVRLAATERFDVLLFDRMMDGGIDGLEALRRLRSVDIRTPALILTNLVATRNLVEGLDAGADDYLAKPFHADELLARLRALVRRAVSDASPDTVVVGSLDVRMKARTAHWAGAHIPLSKTEFEILKCLIEHIDNVVSREVLWKSVWPQEARSPPRNNVIDVNMSRLHIKLKTAAGRALVETVRKQGFVVRSNLV